MRHIDTAVLANSQWRRLYFVSYLLCVIMTALCMNAPWWLVTITGLSSVLVYVLAYFPAQQLRHITSADMTDSSSHWQLLYASADNKQRDELWEMSLIGANGFRDCIQLKFDVIHPMPQQKTVVLWQDQVDADSWRKLKVLSRW